MMSIFLQARHYIPTQHACEHSIYYSQNLVKNLYINTDCISNPKYLHNLIIIIINLYSAKNKVIDTHDDVVKRKIGCVSCEILTPR